MAVFICITYAALLAYWTYQQYSGKTRYSITPSQIFVWSYVPPTPCHISLDDPDCPADSMPTTVAGNCSNEAVCHFLSATELLPPSKRIVATEYWVSDGNKMPGSKARWVKCSAPMMNCPIEHARWESVSPGFGKFKNWSTTTGRTAVVVARIANK